MTNTIKYPTLILASILTVLAFVTAQTFFHLAFAIIFYFTFIFLALMIFPRTAWKLSNLTSFMHQTTPKTNHQRIDEPRPQMQQPYVADIDRRTFIKLIGATSISFFLFSLLGRRIDTFFSGRSGQSVINTDFLGNNNQHAAVSNSPTDGYKISEVDEGTISYYGFTNNQGNWLIMREEIDGGSFRYSKGGSDFPGSWVNRENLKYDYFYALF